RVIRALDLKFPERVVAVGGKWEFRDSLAEIPDTFNMMLDYPDGLSVVALSSMANDAPIPHVLRGHEATLEFNREGFVIRPQERFNKEGDRPAVVHKKAGGEDNTPHHPNLQKALRVREALKCDGVTGYYRGVAVRLAVESYRKSKYMKWDVKRERAIEA